MLIGVPYLRLLRRMLCSSEAESELLPMIDGDSSRLCSLIETCFFSLGRRESVSLLLIFRTLDDFIDFLSALLIFTCERGLPTSIGDSIG